MTRENEAALQAVADEWPDDFSVSDADAGALADLEDACLIEESVDDGKIRLTARGRVATGIEPDALTGFAAMPVQPPQRAERVPCPMDEPAAPMPARPARRAKRVACPTDEPEAAAPLGQAAAPSRKPDGRRLQLGTASLTKGKALHVRKTDVPFLAERAVVEWRPRSHGFLVRRPREGERGVRAFSENAWTVTLTCGPALAASGLELASVAGKHPVTAVKEGAMVTFGDLP